MIYKYFLDTMLSNHNYYHDDVKMEKVPYETDFFTQVKDIFQNRKKRELDLHDSDDGERNSFFNYIKESSVDKCDATGSKQGDAVMKKRRKRYIISSRKHYNSEYIREKRRAEQELLELQHQYIQCNKNAGPNALEECNAIYLRFQKFAKEISEKFHQFTIENFNDGTKIENESKKIKRKQLDVVDHINEIKSPKKGDQAPYLNKNSENVGQRFFGDGFYSYTYNQLPRFHEDLNENFHDFHQQRKSKSMFNREQTDSLPFQTPQRQETVINKDQQAKNIPVKVPEPIGKI